MRARINCLMALVILALLPQQAALAADAKLALPSFQALESKASETVSITLDLYSHVLPEMQRDATNALDKLLGQ